MINTLAHDFYVNSDLIFVSRLEETLDEDDVFFPAGGKNISSKTRRKIIKDVGQAPVIVVTSQGNQCLEDQWRIKSKMI